MTKVKKIGVAAGKPAPKAPAAKGKKAEHGTPSVSNEVIAVRNGVEQTFTRQIWDHLPPSKEGYEEVSIAPSPAVNASNSDNGTGTGTGSQATGDQPVKPASEIITERNAAAVDYKAMFNEEPADDLTTEDIRIKIAEGTKTE